MAELEALRQRLAAIEHERWADWQRWMHRQCERLPSGELVIPAALAERWDRQIATPFEQLSEAEQRSDLEQVDRYWPLVVAALERIPELGTIEELRQQVQRISALAAEARDERDRWRLRAERVEAAAARALDAVPFMDNFEDWNGVPTRLLRELRAALVVAPAEPPSLERIATAIVQNYGSAIRKLDDGEECCPFCEGSHPDPASRPWAAWVGSASDGDGQPTQIIVAPTEGGHVSESGR